jgi:hypothetical protein
MFGTLFVLQLRFVFTSFVELFTEHLLKKIQDFIFFSSRDIYKIKSFPNIFLLYSIRRKLGNRNFAKKTFANRTFATGESTGMCWREYSGHSPIGEIPGCILAKVQWKFANWRNSSEYVGETTVNFRRLS